MRILRHSTADGLRPRTFEAPAVLDFGDPPLKCEEGSEGGEASASRWDEDFLLVGALTSKKPQTLSKELVLYEGMKQSLGFRHLTGMDVCMAVRAVR
mmetsp:Transcript_22196/g.89769  ORF Transcript_22196/g.89769 Transcript_22196/m.89769 type:complete len:97 (-) Transcript_22196:29-319(-)